MNVQTVRRLAPIVLIVTFAALLLQFRNAATVSAQSAYLSNSTVEQLSSAQAFVGSRATALPSAFLKTYPQDGAVDLPVAFRMTWTQAQGATKYLYCFDKIIDHKCEMGGQTGGAAFADANVNQPIRTGMEFWGDANTTYEWQIAAVNASGSTPGNGSGQWFTFTTGHRPAEFKKQSPVNGAILDHRYQTVLTWTQSVGQRYYKYCLNMTGQVGCPDPVNGWIPAGNAMSIVALKANAVPAGTKICYQVRAYYDATGYTPADAVGSWWCFTLR